MRAYIIPTGNTAMDGLRRVDRPAPQPRAGEVLVRVRAASLNRRDQAVITGTYFGKPVARDTIPLSDGAGEVAAVGEGVTRFEPGDRVVATYLQTPPDGPPFADQSSLGFPLDGTAQASIDAEHVERPRVRLLGAARTPAEEQAGALRVELGLDKELRKRGMREVILWTRERDLAVAGDLDLARPVAAVGNRQAPHLDVVFR